MRDGHDWCPECGATFGGDITKCPTDRTTLESRFAYNDAEEQSESLRASA